MDKFSQLVALEKQLEAAVHADWMNSMSDNWYHTSGRYSAAQKKIDAIRSEINDVLNSTAL